MTGTVVMVCRPEGEVLIIRDWTDISWLERISRRPEVLPTFESRKVRRAGTGMSGEFVPFEPSVPEARKAVEKPRWAPPGLEIQTSVECRLPSVQEGLVKIGRAHV